MTRAPVVALEVVGPRWLTAAQQRAFLAARPVPTHGGVCACPRCIAARWALRRRTP